MLICLLCGILVGEIEMTATKLKNKYRGLWYDVYEGMLADLQLNMSQADIEQYKQGNKNCRVITIAWNAAFLACAELDKRLAKIST